MIAPIREFLRKNLPAQAYRSIDWVWWTGRHYLPRRGASLLSRRNPKVQSFPAKKTASKLKDQLGSINVIRVTKICHIMTWHGSDKGIGRHDYTKVYSALFHSLQDKPLRLFELGLGSGNPSMPFYMGENAKPGASLRGWREVFPSARIFGADLDRDILFQENRISTFYCDQLDQTAISSLWSQPEMQGGMDIIIDDGYHSFEANISFLDGSLKHLHPRGIYIVEDITRGALEEWRTVLENTYSHRFPNHEFVLVELPNAMNNDDNNMLVIRRNT